MKTNRFIAILASLVIGMTGISLAQEGYYGQQATEGQGLVANAGSVPMIEEQSPPELHLTKTTKAGNLILTPGDYTFHYRVKGTRHFIHITKEYTVTQVYPETSEITYTEDIGNVMCQLSPLKEPVTHTEVEQVRDGSLVRITKLEIKGDAMAHVL